MIVMDQRNAGGQSRAPITREGQLGHLHLRPHRGARSPEDRQVPPVRPVHRRLVHREPDQEAAPARRVGRVGAADRPRRPHEAGLHRQLRGVDEDPRGPSRGDRAGARRVLSQPLRRRASSTARTASSRRTARRRLSLLAGNDEAHPRPISDELVEAAAQRRSTSRSGRTARRWKRRRRASKRSSRSTRRPRRKPRNAARRCQPAGRQAGDPRGIPCIAHVRVPQ